MLPYNNKDITSIFDYSKKLINKCLRDFAPDAEEHKGKGGLGQLVEELFFHYDVNSRQEADFAFVNAELKCTPLKLAARGKELLIKERLVCSMINLMLENVDRLLNSPAKQRGRDFAIILSSLYGLGYAVEWRVVNAAEYGMPQRRRRTYIVAYRNTTRLFDDISRQEDKFLWLTDSGIMAKAFPCEPKDGKTASFIVGEDIADVSENFNKGKKESPFKNSGLMCEGRVFTLDTLPVYDGKYITLGDILVDDEQVPDEFFVSNEDLPRWEYLKGSKSFKRINKTTGFEYNYSEGAMAFPDYLDRASRTIITGEGGAGPSRFKHIIKTASGRYRRLVPIELERLNMFPDNHTLGSSDLRRAFLMGNALVTGIVERIAMVLESRM